MLVLIISHSNNIIYLAITGMAEQGLNAALFYENPDPKTYISMVPTSAHSGEGMGNLIGMLVNLSQTMLAKRLAFSEELQVSKSNIVKDGSILV